MRWRSVVIAVACLLLANGVATAQATLQPLVIDWARFFRVEAQPSERGGRATVRGTVRNTADWGATQIRLLVEGIDASGGVTAQRVEWLGVDLPPGQYAFFEVPAPVVAPTYRVSVFSFDSGRRDSI